MQSTQFPQESLEQARVLLRELIDRLQTDEPGGQAPASLLRLLVHVANIQRSVAQSNDDCANAVKRLRDFANTIERLDANAMKAADAHDIRVQLVDVLRLAADQTMESSKSESSAQSEATYP